MSIKGGIVSTNNDVELSISISGGSKYKRIYNDVVSVAIDKFEIIYKSLSKILNTNNSSRDLTFYIEQVKYLLHRSHVELLHGNQHFQNKYNIWLLDGYVRMLLETNNMILITQLLDLDSILYSIEEASINQGVHSLIEFDIPDDLIVKSLSNIDPDYQITLPLYDELSAYLHSLNKNLGLLTKMIVENKPAFMKIYKRIIDISSKHLS